MNRRDLQELSKLRIKEAKLLLENGLFDGSYYLSGYAIECALKACIAKSTKQFEFPDKKIVNDSHTHELSKLIRLARLSTQLDTEVQNNSAFQLNWNIVKDWNETSRYLRKTESEARDLYSAISARKNGIMKWIRNYW